MTTGFQLRRTKKNIAESYYLVTNRMLKIFLLNSGIEDIRFCVKALSAV